MSPAAPETSLIALTPKELRKMARREYQNPPLLKTEGQNPQWYIRVRKKVLVGGKSIHKKQTRLYLGLCSEVGIREANRARAEALKEINGETYTVTSQVILGQFVKSYVTKHLPTLGIAAQKKYTSLLANHILPAFGTWKLSDIDTEAIQVWLNNKKIEGLSWWSRNDMRNLLSGIFTVASAWGYWPQTSRNPVELTKLPRERAAREKRLLTDEQVASLLRAFPADVALLTRLTYSTGMRISEVVGLRWKNVDFGRGRLHVAERTYRGEDGPVKSERSDRWLPLGDLADELRDHAARRNVSDEAYVFGYPDGRPYDDRGLNQHFLRKTAKASGFYWKGLGWHSFRRGTVTGVQEIGGSAIEAQLIAGHSKPDMTAHYTIMQGGRADELIRRRQTALRLVERKTA